MKKRLLTFLLVTVVLSLLCSVTVSAVEPRYAYTVSATSRLSITSGTAKCTSKISCYSSVTHIDATQYLEKWDGSNNDGYFEKAIEYNDYETMRILISDFKLKSVSCTIKNDQMSPQIAVQPSYVYSDSDLAALNADDIIDGGAE